MFSVAMIGSLNGSQVYVAKSATGAPAFLIEGASDRHRVPTVLKYLEIAFRIRSHLHIGGDQRTIDSTVVACTSPDPDVQSYFIQLVELLLQEGLPGRSVDVSAQLEVVATLFQRLSAPRRKEAQGLFGELVVIIESSDVATMLAGWHSDPTERFDFAWGSSRLEVKTSARRMRKHRFSQAQCEPPGAGLLASLFVERSTGGATISDLMDRIATMASSFPDLVLKMQIAVRSSLGSDAVQELREGYDLQLASASLEFFDLDSIPAIRGALPDGVSELSFSVDVQGAAPLDRGAAQTFLSTVSNPEVGL